MFKWAATASLLTAISALTINTPPSLVECQPAAITFAEGTAPYFISIVPGGQISAAPLVSFPQQESSPYTWNVNLPAGTNITFILTDSTGTPAYSSPTVIQAGSDTSCLNGTSTSPSGSASGGGASASGGASNTASGSGGASTSSPAQSAQPSGGAGMGKEIGGLVGLLGLAAAAFGVAF